MNNKIEAKGLYLEITCGEYLFVNTKVGKHFFVKPENLEGFFENDCIAYVWTEKNQNYAEIISKENRKKDRRNHKRYKIRNEEKENEIEEISGAIFF